MHAILRAEVVILIHAAREIGVIVEQVVRAMCDEQTQGHNEPRKPGKISIAPGEEARNDAGVNCDSGHCGTGGDQPLGDDIESIPLFLVVHFDEFP